jgi:hypothetical protein
MKIFNSVTSWDTLNIKANIFHPENNKVETLSSKRFGPKGYVFIDNQNIEKFKKILNKEYNDKYEKIHIWTSIQSNYETGLNNVINYTPNNNKYLTIFPKIYQDNNIYLV